jgi:hypothetical protein
MNIMRNSWIILELKFYLKAYYPAISGASLEYALRTMFRGLLPP